MNSGQQYYWRFKGEKAYKYGFASYAKSGLYRMGLYNGDYHGGVVVDKSDIEFYKI